MDERNGGARMWYHPVMLLSPTVFIDILNLRPFGTFPPLTKNIPVQTQTGLTLQKVSQMGFFRKYLGEPGAGLSQRFWLSWFRLLHPAVLHGLHGGGGGVHAELGGAARAGLRAGLVVVVLLDQVTFEEARSSGKIKQVTTSNHRQKSETSSACRRTIDVSQ